MAIRSASMTALGGALLLALAAAPATAKKADDAAAADSAPKLNPSKEARPALSAVQTAIQKNDMATAQAKLADAKAAIHNDDDRYYVGQFTLNIAQATNNAALKAEGVDLMIQSGKAPAEQAQQLYLAGGQTAFDSGNYPKADEYWSKALELKTAEPQLPALLFEVKMREKKPAEAVAELQQAIAALHQAGQKPPTEWYGHAVNEAYTDKMVRPSIDLSMMWLKDYPTQDNWRDSLIIFRSLNNLDADTNLDLMRLMRAKGALKGQGDYVEYADAVYLRFPNEAKSVLDEGVKAGQVNLSAGNAKEDYDAASKRVAADKASLASSPTGTGKQALATADAYASYGDYAKATTLYQQAIQKGGVDPAVANTRLALALLKSGQKAAAKQALAGVTTGPRGTLARYMEIWIDQMA